ncbi:HlyD family type I secretion periplasmic adaptor subunit [Aquabacterium sp. A3]|uniref:HlyD family type I secretion periplasmic adaptor subunit n=1 Tax=Aquabacterium sp. A3 TaxID=3132829 RepID=UPI0031192B43
MRWRSRDGVLHPGDQEFLTGLKDAELVERTPRGTWALYLMCAVVVVGLVWAGLARVDEITRAEGRIIPDGREQAIASLEGGILSQILVREGDLVQIGQPLLQLDPTRVEAQQNEGEARRLALLGALARLSAESSGQPLEFDAALDEQTQIIAGEREAFMTRRQALDEAIEVNRRSLALIRRELEMAQRMAARGLMSEVEVMRLRRQANDFELQIQDRVNRFRQEASLEAVKVRNELAQLDEQMVVKQDVLKRTVIHSPVRGMVKDIRLATVGGVVPAGATIMEIVPVTPKVLVEARVKPADIGFVKVGLPAEVKLTAFDYYTYGGLKGTVEYISPDALGDDPKSGAPDRTYYRVLIRSEQPRIEARGKALDVIPGMTARVEIRTGERSVLQFLLKPVLRSKEAFRER